MKKIMFNDKYGLTQAVLEGRKTQTRRVVPTNMINATDTTCLINMDKTARNEADKEYCCYETSDGDWVDIRELAMYKVGEEVAVAQSYKAVADYDHNFCIPNSNGFFNKMFVRADLMPHRIKITNIRVERLQDISKEDCLKEGIYESLEAPYNKKKYGCYNSNINASSPREAFVALIDKTCGRGTWERNPWAFVYDFELIK